MSARQHPPVTLPRELAQRVDFILNQAALRVSQEVHGELAELGLRARHYAAMILLSERGPQRQVDLAEALEIDRTTTMKLVDDLEALDAVRRDRYPGDRRAHAVTLTDAGIALLERANAQVQQAEDALLGRLSKREREAMHKALASLVELREPPASA